MVLARSAAGFLDIAMLWLRAKLHYMKLTGLHYVKLTTCGHLGHFANRIGSRVK